MSIGSCATFRFHGVKHPNTMGTSEIEQFLTHLATHDKVAASTQNQALVPCFFFIVMS